MGIIQKYNINNKKMEFDYKYKSNEKGNIKVILKLINY